MLKGEEIQEMAFRPELAGESSLRRRHFGTKVTKVMKRQLCTAPTQKKKC